MSLNGDFDPASMAGSTSRNEHQHMKVSVIIPVFNAELFLEKAVESAVQQPQVKEIILVEDASQDHSLKKCKELETRHKQVILFRHPDEKNKGAAASRNLGMQKASCPFIAFLDADDYYLPDRFKKDEEVFDQFPDAEGVYNALSVEYYTQNAAIKKHFKKREFTGLKRALPPEELFYKMHPIGDQGYFHLDTLTIKREVLQKTGLFEPRLKLSQDTHFSVRLAAVCRLYPAEIKKAVAVRGVHENNRSTYSKDINQYALMMYRSLYEWGKQQRLPADKMNKLWHLHYKAYSNHHKRKAKSFWMAKKVEFILRSLLRQPALVRSDEFQSLIKKAPKRLIS